MAGYAHQEDLQNVNARLSARIAAIEEHLVVLSKAAGIPYNPPAAGAPASVVALARQGKMMDAIKEYRSLTGAGLEEAKKVVESI